MASELMLSKAHALADEFELVNQAVIATVEGCSEAQWQAVCEGEGWSVALTALHIAWAHQVLTQWTQSLALGSGVPAVTMDEIDQLNRERAEQHGACTRQEVLDLLKLNGLGAAAVVRGLSDEDLARSAPVRFLGDQIISAEQLISMVLIGHPRNHLASIKAAIGAA